MSATPTAQLAAAIRRGRDRRNWSKRWTDEKYGVAEQVAPLVAAGAVILERANDELTLEGFEPLGPDGQPFVWGPIAAVHRVGGHAIVEYTTRDAFVASEGRMGGGGERRFGTYTTVDGAMRSTCHSHGSLDAALLHAVVYAAEARAHGLGAADNERLTGYLHRVLDLS